MERFTLGTFCPTGNGLLDAQHQVILNYMGKLYSSLLNCKGKEEMLELTDRLDTYCKLHFLEEETVMSDAHFPDMEMHKAQHSLFVKHLESFTGKYEEQNVTSNVNELLFLKNWFIEHIEEFDKKYSTFGGRGASKGATASI